MHLWTHITGDASITVISTRPEIIPELYWDFSDVNMDGEVTLDEYCESSLMTYEFEKFALREHEYPVEWLGAD